MKKRQGSAGHVRYRISGDGKIKIEQIRFVIVGLLSSIVLAALQTGVLGKITFLPFLSPSSPALTMLLVVAAGFFMDKEEAALLGISAGFFTDAATGTGFMILPVLYFVLGYAVGAVKGSHLGHNLPSFMVFSIAACTLDVGFHLTVAAIEARGLPTKEMLLFDMLPHVILTLLFAPLVYGLAKIYTTKRLHKS